MAYCNLEDRVYCLSFGGGLPNYSEKFLSIRKEWCYYSVRLSNISCSIILDIAKPSTLSRRQHTHIIKYYLNQMCHTATAVWNFLRLLKCIETLHTRHAHSIFAKEYFFFHCFNILMSICLWSGLSKRKKSDEEVFSSINFEYL